MDKEKQSTLNYDSNIDLR